MSFDEVIGHVYRLEYAALETKEVADLLDGDGRTLLMHAVLDDTGTPKMVELLIRRGVPVDVADGGQRWTALHFAARDQKEAIVRALVRAGATVDALDAFGNTPLYRCVDSGYAKRNVVEALIEHGADPSRKNAAGVSPIEVAERYQVAGIAAALRGERTTVQAFSAKVTYAPGDRLAHPQFGEGTVRKLLPDRKIEVEFAGGARTLIHGR